MLIHILYFLVTKNHSNTVMTVPADIQRIYSKAWFIRTNAEKEFSCLFSFPNVAKENSLLFMNDLRQLMKPVNARVKWKSVICVQLFATSWTIQSMEFSRPDYWSGEPFLSPGDLPNPGIELRSPALQVDSFFTSWATREAFIMKNSQPVVAKCLKKGCLFQISAKVSE